MFVPGMSKTLIHHDNHNLKQVTGVATPIIPNLSFKITASSHLITCNPWRSQTLSHYSVDPEIYSWSKDQLYLHLLKVSPSPSKQVLRLYLQTLCDCLLSHPHSSLTIKHPFNSPKSWSGVESNCRVRNTASYCHTRPDLQNPDIHVT